MDDALIPQTYEQWHHCITVICQQPLTLDYIDQRIKALDDNSDYMTKKFVELYGESQLSKTQHWFKTAKEKLQVEEQAGKNA